MLLILLQNGMMKYLFIGVENKKRATTMCKSNSGFRGNFSGSGSILLRQICDLTNFQRLKIWLISCNELKPLLSATALAPDRWAALVKVK